MRGGTAFFVPQGSAPVVQGWVERVNERAGRKIVDATAGIVRAKPNGNVIAPGKVILVVDPIGRTQPCMYHVLDELEMKA